MNAPRPLRRLEQIHADIDARVQTIRASRPDWLCAKGCDGCCRHLADVPQLTAREWDVLRVGLAALPAEQLAAIGARLAALPASPSYPVSCPLLDTASGACPVYAQRPVACRSYGFYVQRERGLFCAQIESQVAAGALNDAVWGNHDALDRQLVELGETRALGAWFALWQDGQRSA